jgi:uncharacterized repeat protein (TIGR01451 family)
MLGSTGDRRPKSSPAWRVSVLALALLIAAASPAAAATRLATGSYTGDGVAGRAIDSAGFRPDLVILRGNLNEPTLVRTADMPPDAAKPLGGSFPLRSDCIVSFDPTGFTVGSDPTANSSGVEYYWVAFQASPGELALGSYVGDGTDDRSITGLGFAPAYVMAMNADGLDAMQRYATEVGDRSLPFQASDEKSDRIQALESDGFQIGKNPTVNQLGKTVYYAAWSEASLGVSSGIYTGNATDDRAITEAGFSPVIVLLTRRQNGSPAVLRTASMPVDFTLPADKDSAFADGIQGELPGGFEIGTSDMVNGDGQEYLWAAFRSSVSLDLSVGKAADRSVAEVGETITYTVSLSNQGAVDATGIIVSENLPAGISLLSALASRGHYTEADSLWRVDRVGPGETVTLTLSAVARPEAAGTIVVNTAALVHLNEIDTDSGNDQASVSVAIRGADLAVGKLVAPAKPSEGDPILYTITVKNLGPDDATGVAVTDLLPAGVTYTGHVSGAGEYSSTTGEWTAGLLEAGQSAVLSISAMVNTGTGGATILNRAFVSASDVADPDTTNNEGTASFGSLSADLTLTKGVDTASPSEGDTLVYTITVSNAGPDTATSVTAVDAIPAELSHVSDDTDQGAYSALTGLWSIGTLPPGGAATLHIAARVAEGTTGTTIVNSAAIASMVQADPSGEDDADEVAVTVRGVDLAVFKSASDRSPEEGDEILFRIHVRNAGPDTARAVSILDLLPMGVSFVADSLGQGAYDPGSGVWSFGSLPPDADAVLAITVTVDPGAGGTNITNTAALIGSEPADIDPANDVSSVTIQPQKVDLALAKSASGAWADEGGSLVYTVQLSNLGPADASSVVVTDLLPAGTTYISGYPGRGTYDHSTGLWNVGSLANGAATTLTVTVAVNDGTGGSVLTNTAAISASQPMDHDLANNVATVNTPVRLADLGLVKTVGDATVREGDTPVFTITLRNAGPDSATGVTVIDPLAPGLSHVADAATRGYFLPGTGIWIVGELAPGDSASLTITTLVNAGAAGETITNTASVASADAADPDPADNVGSAAIVVFRDEAADLALSKQVDSAAPNAGATLSYTIHLANAGPDTATGVAVTDKLPVGLTYSGRTSSQGAYSPVSGLWTVGTLAPGGSATLVLIATVNAGTAGVTITNTALVTARDQIDANPGNDAAAATIAVQGADLTLTKDVSRSTASLGDTLTYTITLGNAGPSTATGVRVTDSLPEGSSLVDASTDHGSFAPTGVWDVGTLPPAEPVSLVLRVRINTDYSGVLIRNIAAIIGVDQADPHPGAEADSASTVLPSADLDVRLSLSETAPVVGDPFTCTVTVANKGPNLAGVVVIALPLPTSAGLNNAVASAGDYDAATGRWTPGTLAAGGEATLALTLTPSPGSAGDTLVFTAEVVAADRDDPDPDNNRDSATAVPEHPLFVTVDAQSGTSLLPGAAPKEVLHMRVINRSAAAVTLTALTLSNAATGSGTPAQLDQNWSALTLVVDGVPESVEPPQATFDAGVATFGGLDLSVPSRGERGLSVRGGASLTARDGDALDLKVTGPGGVVFAGGIHASGDWPFDPPGAFLVDGMTTAQIEREDIASGTILLGERRRLALDATIPPNGYEADIWSGLSLVNLGDADPEADIRSVEVWRDGGNGRFDGGLPDDVSLGKALWRDGRWELGTFWRSLPTTGLHIYASVDVDTLATSDRTIRLAIPVNGIVVESNNDGPIDGDAPNGGTLVIASTPSEVILASAEVQSGRSLLPGDEPESLFRLHLYNNSKTTQVLTRLALVSAATGSGAQAQLDADWSGLALTSDLPDGTAGLSLATAHMSSGAVTFSGFAVAIPAESDLTLAVRGGASLAARDGDRLDLFIPDATGFSFAQSVPVLGTWPLSPSGTFLVDGMAAAQVTLHPVEHENLAAGSRRSLVLDVMLPPNGYEPDQLTRLNLVNLGSALPEADISEVEAWLDDGDGVFVAAEDRLLGSLRYTGDRWEITGLAEPVPLGGLRAFVTADVAPLATEGRTLQFQIPASQDVGVGMTSSNDGPRDMPVTNPEVAAITTSNRITLTATPLATGITHPGARNVPLLRLAATNTYDTAKSVSRLSFTSVSRREGVSIPNLDAVVQSVELRLDANQNGVLDASSEDPVLGTALFLAGRADFDGLQWELQPDRTQHVFLSAAVSMTSASDGDVLGATIEALRDVTFGEPVTVAAGWPIDSGGRWTVDGMVADQVAIFSAGSVTIGPGEGPIPVLDFIVPANGELDDVVHGVQVMNLGDAGPEEIAELRSRPAGCGSSWP